MAYRTTPLVTNQIFHLYNCGVEKRDIFLNKRDYERFLDTFVFYQQKNPPVRFSLTSFLAPSKDEHEEEKLVEIYCYCLMPNHFHFLVKQLIDKGISIFMSKLLNSYTKYFNTKNKRLGHLMQGSFKAVMIENEEQFFHTSRYIHLNPFVSGLINNLNNYEWSSYSEYLGKSATNYCEKGLILDNFKSSKDYEKFVLNHAEYARSLEKIKHLVVEV